MAGYENYDLQEFDPYLLPDSTCLINNLGITDTGLLNQAETDISAAAMAELLEDPVAPSFDLQHLQTIHARLFGDVYPWAGEDDAVAAGVNAGAKAAARKQLFNAAGQFCIRRATIVYGIYDTSACVHECIKRGK